jgi:RHS repeat-associated protein
MNRIFPFLSISLLVLSTAWYGESEAFEPSVEATRSPGAESFQTELFTGRLSTAVPIAVPPGRGNLQPRLALVYQSGGGNGWCGVGWTLGLGAIERSPKAGVPTYNDALDTFTASLNGVNAELVAIGGGEYRAKNEAAFMKFEHTAGQWRVLDKRGTEYLFGSGANSRLTTSQGTFRWYLDRVTDVHGNTMTVSYAHDGGEVYLNQSTYTDEFYTVDFQLEDRPDVSTSVISGEVVITAKRLRAVEVRANDALVRRYELTYQQSQASQRSLLSRVTQTGNDSVSTLPPMSLSYNDAWANVGRPTEDTAGSSSYLGFLPFAGSFRGHGLDIGLYDQKTGQDKEWIILPRNQYDGSFCVFGEDTTPQPADFNGDGLTDAGVQKNSGEWQVALAELDSTSGCKFRTPQTWHPGFGGGQQPIGGDFNGDGFADAGTFNESSGEWQVALSDGTQFLSPTTWLTGFGSGAKSLTGDFNGDGLTDAGAFYDDGHWEVALSNGSQFLSPEVWLTGFGANQTAFSGDFNVDGKTDVGVYDDSSGNWQIAISRGTDFEAFDTEWLTGFGGGADWLPFAGNFDNSGRTVAGIYNRSSGEWKLKTFLPDTQPPDYLKAVDNGVGGTSTTRYANYDPNDAKFLPFPVVVVAETTHTDTITGNSFTTRYEYNACLYDGNSREFRGFRRARIIDPEGNITETWFHQDEILKGKPQKIQQRDSTGNVYTETQNIWQATEPHPGVHFPFLAQTDGFTFDGDATSRQTRTRWEYDNFGNVIVVHSEGEVKNSSDHRLTETTYVPFNLNAWLIGFPERVETFDAQNLPIAQRTFFYDGSENTGNVPTKGNLTMVEDRLLSDPANSPRTRMEYDAHGNLSQTTDANGNITKTRYDDTLHLYPTRVENALGQVQVSTYDRRTGQVLTTTDPNNQTTANRYDAFGRLTAVIGPLDSETHPAVTYEYDLTRIPTHTVVRTREAYSTDAVLESITYFDGFGRAIQTRMEAEEPGQQLITQAVTFDSRGQIASQWLPYFITKTDDYTPPNPADPQATFEYDPIGRLIRTENPDGTVRRTTYTDWVVTNTDENGNETVYTNDAYGRLIKVEEHNGNEVYTTKYEYDAQDNLVGTLDHAGNRTEMRYDSLGRKQVMNDPDMGFWAYAYDLLGNLISQTDAKSQTITFTYDLLNRLTGKHYPDGVAVTYTYDNPDTPNGIGRLAHIIDRSGVTTFQYDAVGREIRTVRRVDGTEYVVERVYDTLDRLTQLTYPDGEVVTYTYNAAGQIEGVEGAETYLERMEYSAAGQPTTLEYGNGVQTDYTYDPQTLRLKTLKSTGNSQLQHFEYRYDSVGNILGITDHLNTATQTFTYDALYRLTRANAPDSYGQLDYAYNTIGNLTQKGNVTLSYGEAGHGGGPHAVTGTSNGLEIRYDPNGNMTQRGAATYRYDYENRMVEVKLPEGGRGSITLNLAHGWNFLALPVIPDSLLLKDLLADLAPSTDYTQVSRFKPETQTFEHYLGEAAEVSRFNQFEAVEYGRGYQIYIENPAGVTLTVEGQLPDGTTPVTLSPDWNLIACPTPTEILVAEAFPNLKLGEDYDTVIGYNGTTYDVYTGNPDTDTLTTLQPGRAYFIHCPRVASWEPPVPSSRFQFVYDGDGGRVKKITPASTTLYIGGLYEITNGVATKHIFAGAARIASKNADGVLFFYHTDHLGSSNSITDRDGTQVQLLEYLPFGGTSREAGDGSFGLGYRYTGQEFDAETGLYFYGARCYDAELGRFVGPDSIVPELQNPQAFNRYSYVYNNPIIYTDPSGNFPWLIPALIGAFVGGFSAAQAGGDFGDIFLGAAFGFVTGTVFGGLGNSIIAGIPQGATIAQTALITGTGQAVTGFGTGLAAGFAGGQGSFSDTLRGGFLGAVHGFASGAITGLVKGGIENFIINNNIDAAGNKPFDGFELTLERGGPAVDKSRLASTQYAVRGPNNIFLPKGSTKLPQLVPFGKKLTPILAQFIEEGGFVSETLNLIPGANSVSVFHDTFAGVSASWVDANRLPSLLKPLLNQGTIIPAIGITYVGLGAGDIYSAYRLLEVTKP